MLSSTHSMKKSKKKNRTRIELTEEQTKEIMEAFKMFDTNNVGKIELKDLKVAMMALGFEPKKDDLKKMIGSIDKESIGSLEFDAFKRLMEDKLNEKDEISEIENAFHFFKNDQGIVNFDLLKSCAKELKIEISDHELGKMIKEADRGGNGEITFDDFKRIILNSD